MTNSLAAFTSNELFIGLYTITYIITTNSQWTPFYGGVNGNASILLSQPSNPYITEICVRAGSLIDALQVTWIYGIESEWVGGPDGQQSCYQINPAQCFVSITIRAGALIDSLQFGTSDGQSSPSWGGNGGREFNYNGNTNQCITAIELGYSNYEWGGTYVDIIRFYFSNVTNLTKYPTQSPTEYPTASPSFNPSIAPSELPSLSPSNLPSISPSIIPTVYPSNNPSSQPSISPSKMPSYSPRGTHIIYLLSTCYNFIIITSYR